VYPLDDNVADAEGQPLAARQRERITMRAELGKYVSSRMRG
jgi:hypothetical protein